MSFTMILSTVFEIALVGFTLWAVFHEDRIAAIEKQIFARIRRRKFRVIEGGTRFVRER